MLLEIFTPQLAIAPIVIAGMIAAGAQIAQTIAQNRARKKADERYNQSQAEAAELAHNRDLELWNKQNEYNAPLAQRERLQLAGLNENLVYGSGNVTGNTAGNLPKYQKPNTRATEMSIPDMAGTITQFQNLRQQDSQINNTKAVVDLNKQKADTEEAKELNILADTASKEGKESRAGELHKYDITSGKHRNFMELRKIDGQIIANAKLKLQKKTLKNTLDLQTEAINLAKWKSELAKHNMTPNDSYFLRATKDSDMGGLGTIVPLLMGGLSSKLFTKLKPYFKKWNLLPTQKGLKTPQRKLITSPKF